MLGWLHGDLRLRRLRLPLVIAVVLVCTGAAYAIAASASKKAPDRDGDGLSNRYERRASHTSVRRRDTDRDGLRDGPEVRRYKTDPRKKDTDGDSLSDRRELRRLKTNPRKRDTDRDGLGDGAEVRRYKTNPRKKDTDGDGLGDGAEVRRYKTDPLQNDTDGDGRSDGDEVEGNTNPLTADGPPAQPGAGLARPCTQTVGSLDAVTGAVAAAAPGAVVCLAPGSYGQLSVAASKPAEVVVQAAVPGQTTVRGASLGGSHLTLSHFNVAGDEVTVEPGSDHATVQYNRISGGYYGVQAGPTTTTTVDDVTIRGNRFVGNFGEDAIRLNRYHDGPDSDPYGVLIEGNEISGVVENGEHNDCLQSVWAGDHLYFRRNYLHDNNCQGFFVKDQDRPIDTVVFEDNLIVDHNLPCQPASLCPTWKLAPLQVFGPINTHVVRRNTIWTADGSGVSIWRGSGLNGMEMANNVIFRAESDTTIAGFSEHHNTVCRWSGLPALSPTSTVSCSPGFRNPGADDYRLPGDRGVSWAPAGEHYGP